MIWLKNKGMFSVFVRNVASCKRIWCLRSRLWSKKRREGKYLCICLNLRTKFDLWSACLSVSKACFTGSRILRTTFLVFERPVWVLFHVEVQFWFLLATRCNWKSANFLCWGLLFNFIRFDLRKDLKIAFNLKQKNTEKPKNNIEKFACFFKT